MQRNLAESLLTVEQHVIWRHDHDLRDNLGLLLQLLGLLALLSCFAVVPHTFVVGCCTGMTVNGYFNRFA